MHGVRQAGADHLLGCVEHDPHRLRPGGSVPDGLYDAGDDRHHGQLGKRQLGRGRQQHHEVRRERSYDPRQLDLALQRHRENGDVNEQPERGVRRPQEQRRSEQDQANGEDESDVDPSTGDPRHQEPPFKSLYFNSLRK